MQSDVYRADGYNGAVYIVFPKNTKAEDAIKEAARIRKMKSTDLETVAGWTYKDGLYLNKKAPAKKAVQKVVVRKRKG